MQHASPWTKEIKMTSSPGGETVVLFRPVGEAQLNKVRENRFLAFPQRLPEQPIFYPVLNEEYAAQIARDWNARGGERGYVLRFSVDASYLAKFEIHQVGARTHQEYWIPAEQLEEFNRNIVGVIEVIATF